VINILKTIKVDLAKNDGETLNRVDYQTCFSFCLLIFCQLLYLLESDCVFFVCLVFVVSRDVDVDGSHVSFFFSCRFMLAVIGFFIFLHLYAQRIGMSVAIVCMLNQTALDDLESLQTVNATNFAGNRRNATEWLVNVTVSSAESHCSRRLDDGTVVHMVGSCCFVIVR